MPSPRSRRRAARPGRRSAHALGFIGGGNMAAALVRGLLAAGLHRPRDILVAEPDASQRRRLARAFRVDVTADNHAVATGAMVVVLAVKPQVMDAVLAGIRPAVNRRTLFVSIAAGVPLARLENALGPQIRVVRVMPNTPALVGRGMSVVVGGRHASPRDVARARALFGAVGDAIALPDERLLDAVTGLSGSGPAFVYAFAEALIAGGTIAGLAPDLAARLALKTVAGAAAMLLETGKSPTELRAMVTSPGGTTLAGLRHLETKAFAQIVAGAVDAATARARELARG
jgi:pyrroline-5-carboxylate reductase